jgi:hypothetical protein
MSTNHLYFTTLYKSYWVCSSCTTKITLPFDTKPRQCLAVTKSDSIEFLSLVDETLETVLELDFFGEIIHIRSIPLEDESKPDFLFLLTKDLRYAFGSVVEGVFYRKYEGDFENLSQTPCSEDEKVFSFYEHFPERNEHYIGVMAYQNDLKILCIKTKIDDAQVTHLSFRLNLGEVLSLQCLPSLSHPLEDGKVLAKAKHSIFIGILCKQDNNVISFEPFELNLLDRNATSIKQLWFVELDQCANPESYRLFGLSEARIAIIGDDQMR